MKRRLSALGDSRLGAAFLLAAGGTIAEEVMDSSGAVCATDRDAIRAWIREGAKNN
jgi:hypothetical protein